MPVHPHHAESSLLNVAVALTHAQEELPPAYPWSGDSLLASLQPPRKGPAEDMDALLGEYHASRRHPVEMDARYRPGIYLPLLNPHA